MAMMGQFVTLPSKNAVRRRNKAAQHTTNTSNNVTKVEKKNLDYKVRKSNFEITRSYYWLSYFCFLRGQRATLSFAFFSSLFFLPFSLFTNLNFDCTS
jgi:hypothetical protein